MSRGLTPSYNEGETISESETIAPFHELKKRWRVASREFLSLADFLTTKLIKLKNQAKQHWAVQPPEGKTIFFKAVTVQPLPRGRERLPMFLARVLARPCYPHAVTKVIKEQPLQLPPPPPDEEDDRDIDYWRTEKPVL